MKNDINIGCFLTKLQTKVSCILFNGPRCT